MTKRLSTKLSSNDIFLPPDLKGQARICVELLETGQVFCSVPGEISSSDKETRNASAKIKLENENEDD